MLAPALLRLFVVMSGWEGIITTRVEGILSSSDSFALKVATELSGVCFEECHVPHVSNIWRATTQHP